MGGESNYFIRWAGHHANVLNAEQDLGRARVYVRVVPPLLNAASFALLLVVGGLRIIDGTMTIGTLVAFQLVILCLMEPVSRLVHLEQQIQETTFDLDRLEDVLRSPRDLHAALDTGDADERLKGSVDLKDVTFGYSRLDPPVLKGLSLSVRPGERIALVGASGSGKSTVAKLIAGLCEPWSGEVLFDGRPRSAIQRSTLANALAIVEQDGALLRGTVRENLALWDSTLSDPRIVSAAKDAQIHDDILQRRGGYDHEVEESGANFSGGQRQRLEIARALAANPRILILDEATSGLDPCVERLLDSSLNRRDCACVVIAHRLSSIRDCDQILVLDRGAVVQRGRHDELAHVDGPYRRLLVTT
jgi:ABC-type bacteriocin/lantibiotic exporter with double-glycine peptidase domain